MFDAKGRCTEKHLMELSYLRSSAVYFCHWGVYECYIWKPWAIAA